MGERAAGRLRDESHGCRQWDEAGAFACLKEALAGQNLLSAVQRVIGHATDPNAQTPEAIKRPLLAEPTDAPKRQRYDPREWCHTCGHPEARCRANMHGDHDFLSVEQGRAIGSGPVPEQLRAAISNRPHELCRHGSRH